MKIFNRCKIRSDNTIILMMSWNPLFVSQFFTLQGLVTQIASVEAFATGMKIFVQQFTLIP